MFHKRRKMLRDMIYNREFIITGSRALKCYQINDSKLLNREADDWDLIITRDQFLKLCRDYNIYNVSLESNEHRIDAGFRMFTDTYSDDGTSG